MTGLAGFDFQALNQRYMAQPSNDAAGYGVSIVRARSLNAYRCIGAYHLTPAESGGRHNIFVEVLDEQGHRDKSPLLNWTASLDLPVQSKRLDEKPDNEPAADIPMNAQDTVTVRINDGKPGGDSDSVGGLHFRHADPGSGDVWGHVSFYIVFQRQVGIVVAPPIEPPVIIPPAPLTLESLARQVAELKSEVDALKRIIGQWTGGK